jgi:outer membrane receptor for ferrienterochelin and colicins
LKLKVTFNFRILALASAGAVLPLALLVGIAPAHAQHASPEQGSQSQPKSERNEPQSESERHEPPDSSQSNTSLLDAAQAQVRAQTLGEERGESSQASPSPLDAAQSDSNSDPFQVERVIVTAARREQSQGRAAVKADVITRRQMRQTGAQDAAEALEEHPHVQVTRSFRGAGVRLRGLDSEHVLVLIDGQRVTGRTGGVLDLTRFDVENIERIEIVRGASSALYGSDAIGGVVNIITRRPSAPHAAGGRLEYGYAISPRPDSAKAARERSFLSEQGHLFEATASGSIRRDRWDLQLSAGYDHAGSYDLFPQNIATTGSAHDGYQLQAKGHFEPTDAVSLSGRVNFRRRDQLGIDQNAAGAVFDREQIQQDLSVALGSEIQLGGGHILKLTGSYGLFRDQFLRDQRGANALDEYQDNRQHQAQLTLQTEWLLAEAHLLTVGYESLMRVLDSPRVQGTGKRARLSPYVQHEWTVLEDPYFVVVPGFRLDGDTQFGVQPSPKLATRIDPSDELRLRASAGHGFRAPSFKELLLRFENPSVGYVVRGNPNLEPERAWTLDVGGDYDPVDWLALSVTGYRNWLHNLILAQSMRDPGRRRQQFVYRNVASAHTQGVEAAVRLEPLSNRLRFDLSYTLTDSENEREDRALEGRARHRGTIKAQWKPQGTGLTLMTRAAVVGPRPFYEDPDGDGTETTTFAGSYVQLDARVGWKIGELLTLFVGMDNLTDAGGEYLTIRPRTVYGGLTANYQAERQSNGSGKEGSS